MNPSRKFQFKTILGLLSLCLLPELGYAQADHGHGGDINEGDLKHALFKLDQYLYSAEGMALFPEVVAYDQKVLADNREGHRPHRDTLHEIAISLHPTLVSGPVRDAAGVERDCVSYTKPYRYFKCNRLTLNQFADTAPDGIHHPSFYRILFHEILVQAGLENPVNREIRSAYPIASRLDVHLETYEAWMPGPGASVKYYRCKVGYATQFENDPNFRVPFGFLKTQLHAKNIDLIEIEYKNRATAEMKYVLEPKSILSGTHKHSVRSVELSVLNPEGHQLLTAKSLSQPVDIIKERPQPGEQIQMQYQIQSGDSKPLGFYIEQFRHAIHFLPKHPHSVEGPISLNTQELIKIVNYLDQNCR